MELTTYNDMTIYRGQASTGQIVCIDKRVMLVNQGSFSEQELSDPDGWLEHIDGENTWIAAQCEVCGDEYRPIDGYYEAGEYSYCRDCCHW